MPLQHVIHINPHAIIGVWHLTEDEAFFARAISKLVPDTNPLDSISHTKRRTEWLAGRYLVMELVERMYLPFNGIWTDEYNKPHLVTDVATISLSHATPYVVAILNTKSPCGIDVEKIRTKLRPLAPKFLNKNELSAAEDDLTNLAILWGAKEALYKLHGRKSLIFKENLAIKEFKFKDPFGSCIGLLEIDNEHEIYSIKAGKFNDYVLVYTEEPLNRGTA
jgi:4'-phosphopantetheinyl transferase